VHGYASFLAALADPKHADMQDWIGRAFDPAAFAVDAINRALATIKP